MLIFYSIAVWDLGTNSLPVHHLLVHFVQLIEIKSGECFESVVSKPWFEIYGAIYIVSWISTLKLVRITFLKFWNLSKHPLLVTISNLSSIELSKFIFLLESIDIQFLNTYILVHERTWTYTPKKCFWTAFKKFENTSENLWNSPTQISYSVEKPPCLTVQNHGFSAQKSPKSPLFHGVCFLCSIGRKKIV